MKVFISWSGRKSKSAAYALRDWLPDVIQSVNPWMSEADITPGERWSKELQDQLAESRYGILSVTKSNLNAPWLLFEAGSLAKTLTDTFVCPFLIDLDPRELPDGPLKQFQAVVANKQGSQRLLSSINDALPDGKLTSDQLGRAFDRWWPDLNRKLDGLPEDENIDTSIVDRQFPYSLILSLPSDVPAAVLTLIDWDDTACFLIGPGLRENVRLVPSRVGPSLHVELSEETLQRLIPEASYEFALKDHKGHKWRVRRFYPFETVLPLEPLESLVQIVDDFREELDE